VLTPDEFDEEYDDEKLAEELPDWPITSLRDVQYLYGRLYTMATAGGGDYAAYLTPDDARELVDTDESLIAARVDLSGDDPRLAEDPVLVTGYTEDLIESVAHSRFPAARGIDHSVTHKSGRDSDPEKLARYAKERLTRWATDDVVRAAADEHEDGWMIDALATLGEDETVAERIEDAVKRELGGPRTALLTVQVKIEAGGEYRWPGDVAVFSEAMRARKNDKLVSKGQATDSSGTATDLVTGERTRTVGTAEDPLNYYLGKQMETFPGLDPDEAWRTHSISEDAAVTVMNAETFVDACTYRAFNASVYYLPYFLGDVSPEEARHLYGVLYQVAAVEEDMTPVERTYRWFDGEQIEEYGSRLRFYVAAVMKHQMSRYDVYGDTMNGLILHPVRLREAHLDVLGTWPFADVELSDGRTMSGVLPTHENWLLLRGETREGENPLLNAVAGGAYLYNTLPEGDDDTDASADDFRIQALIAVLSGDTIPVNSLLEGYVDRTVEETDRDEGRFPSFVVASQFAQLCALAQGGQLQADGDQTAITAAPAYDTTLSMKPDTTRARTDGGTFAADRTRKLEQFLDDTPALDQHPRRRGVFLLGALVGAVGSYQEYSEDRSTTLVDQYPVKSVTTARLKKITQEAIDKTLTYTREARLSSTMFGWIVDELRRSILGTGTDADEWTEPEQWTLDTDDLRFYYALGVTYGMNDYVESDDKDSNDAD